MKNRLPYSHVAIIYNPNSTGDAPALAKQTASELKEKYPGSDIALKPTEHAGHAEQMAYDITCSKQQPLIVSVSGDGGYHEVINGALKAQVEDASRNPVLSLVGAGNANDHFNALQYRPIAESITGEPLAIDLLQITVSDSSGSTTRYAHAYAGVGISPKIGQELNKHKLHLVKELQIIIRALTQDRPVLIEHAGKTYRVDSLLFANIIRMAKILTLNDKNSLHDGKFEVIEIPYDSRWRLLRTFLRASIVGLKDQPRCDSYTFVCKENMPLQLDGEILECKTDTRVDVGVAEGAVRILR